MRFRLLNEDDNMNSKKPKNLRNGLSRRRCGEPQKTRAKIVDVL